MLSFIVVYLIFLAFILVCSYYYDLFTAKEEFLKSELTEIKPFFEKLYDKILKGYRLPVFLLVLIFFSFLGGIIPVIFTNWFFNSSILFIAAFFIVPYLRDYFNSARVTSSESLSDNVINVFIKYNLAIVIGFGAGYASSLINNWRQLIQIHSLFFLLNILIIAILLVIFIKKNLTWVTSDTSLSEED